MVTGGIDSRLGSLTATGVDAVFAAGDVREGAVRRISAAVGEGSAASLDMNAYLVNKGTWREAIKEGTALHRYYEATAPRASARPWHAHPPRAVAPPRRGGAAGLVLLGAAPRGVAES
ncbi:hypothetical protein ACFV07_19525 [Streptomyces anulatus]|uniref:hypothetical protein n=1 Tax=Streptomyces anulatus TaxID=1892 RepID=UPI0036BB10F4